MCQQKFNVSRNIKYLSVEDRDNANVIFKSNSSQSIYQVSVHNQGRLKAPHKNDDKFQLSPD